MSPPKHRTWMIPVVVAAAAIAVPGTANALVQDPLHGHLVEVPMPDGSTLCVAGGEAFLEAFAEQDAAEMAAAVVHVAPAGEPCPEAHHG